MAPSIPNDIILYHYPFSPYARRIIWYLALRNIPYAQSLQPPYLPRPTLTDLGVSYRRIPLLSIGSDIYCDTRLILSTLDRLFPASPSHPALSSPSTAGTAALLSSFTIDGGVFARSAQLIPPQLPLLNDPKFTRDREDFMGRSWAKENIIRQRPEAIVHMRSIWDLYETLLADGRDWVGGTEGVTLADIDGAWPLVWLRELKTLDDDMFGTSVYPRTHAWIKRFEGVIKVAMDRGAKVVKVKDGEIFDAVVGSGRAVARTKVESDPTGLREGQDVMVWPLDTGFNHKDHGKLVGLNKDEVVIAVKTKKDPSKEVRIHAPRWGFRVAPAGDKQAKL
ncbi:2,3-bisphosphoglycerate-dependent phosphoglycerate mutase [Sphaceloma murrayae]|uniref:2,3-bisphosphoglycerate-dependent phosphoglycerate mutase n=1 Tax=Sphaceloma murrayae TaxID=2082308 RepID=A0A2K1QSY9_9PEZI|nr:2,3-bisphosphoglycerate-dependent phosphoglycerate mutase [Sphaceloma murrayae]